MTTKKCSKCGEVKPLDQFHVNRKCKDGHYSACIPCRRPVKRAEVLKRLYGITVEDYDYMLKRQHYGCKICGKQCDSGMRLAVDHCHSTGAIRGLLCGKCNKAIGLLDDDVNRMNLAQQYLTASGEWFTSESKLIPYSSGLP